MSASPPRSRTASTSATKPFRLSVSLDLPNHRVKRCQFKITSSPILRKQSEPPGAQNKRIRVVGKWGEDKPEEIVRDQERPYRTPFDGHRNVGRPVPRPELVRTEHLVEPGSSEGKAERKTMGRESGRQDARTTGEGTAEAEKGREVDTHLSSMTPSRAYLVPDRMVDTCIPNTNGRGGMS